MTKKHFEAIAAILKDEQVNTTITRRDATRDVAHRLADYFSNENPRFDRERFLKACGID